MRDYNQINLGKLRNNPPKGGRYSASSMAVNQQAQQQAQQQQNQQSPYYTNPNQQHLHNNTSQFSAEEEKKVDHHEPNPTTSTSNMYMASPKEHASVSTAPSTPSHLPTTPTTPGSTSSAMEHNASYQAASLEAANIPHQSTTTSSASSLQANDALAMRQQGAEATIVKLRSALDEASQQDSSAKSALAKSDAVILELRSSVRQLKRQLDRVQEEKVALEKERGTHNNANNNPPSAASYDASSSMDARVGELQVQLDRAHAQILTADMVRKELEDTLEAEQYTWELRVQDQERQIAELQLDNDALTANIDSLQKEVEQLQETVELERRKNASNNTNASDNNNNNDSDTAHLQEKLMTLEQERAELQACLDEALKELEAVDEELKTDSRANNNNNNNNNGNAHALVEPLQHLHRLVLERDGVDQADHTIPQEPREIIASIHDHIDNTPSAANNNNNTALRSMPSNNDERLREVEQKLAACQRDLKTREDSAAELRASLKEAVSLLKPLQDAVAKSDREKARLQQQLDQVREHGDSSIEQTKKLKSELALREKESDRLRQEISNLEIQLTRERAKTATSLVQAQKNSVASSSSPTNASSVGDTPGSARARLRAKRAEEQALKQMLDDARNRFRSLHQQNQDVEALNTELQAKLESPTAASNEESIAKIRQELEEKETVVNDLQDELTVRKGELAKKEVEMRDLERELAQAKELIHGIEDEDRLMLDDARTRVQDLEKSLDDTVAELRSKKEAEKKLNKSLKEALNLLRPLQMHLEEAELEKKQMAAEIDDLKQQISMSNSGSPSGSGNKEQDLKHIQDLEYAVTQLEKENTQLHDALEDMSQTLNASHISGQTGASQKNDSRLKEEIVELKSRYEVTQSRLQDAFVENHSLVEALRKREEEEHRMIEELNVLRKRLGEPPKNLPSSASAQPQQPYRPNQQQRSNRGPY